jgi:hypothetical protein
MGLFLCRVYEYGVVIPGGYLPIAISSRDNPARRTVPRPPPETSVAPPLGSRLSSPPAGVWHLPRSLFLGSASTETVVVLPPPHSRDSRIRMPVANAPFAPAGPLAMSTLGHLLPRRAAATTPSTPIARIAAKSLVPKLQPKESEDAEELQRLPRPTKQVSDKPYLASSYPWILHCGWDVDLGLSSRRETEMFRPYVQCLAVVAPRLSCACEWLHRSVLCLGCDGGELEWILLMPSVVTSFQINFELTL